MNRVEWGQCPWKPITEREAVRTVEGGVVSDKKVEKPSIRV
jgi:hypothetical protein